MARDSSDSEGPWYGNNVLLRFVGGGLGIAGGGGVGGLFRVAVASNRDIIKAL